LNDVNNLTVRNDQLCMSCCYSLFGVKYLWDHEVHIGIINDGNLVVYNTQVGEHFIN